MYPFYLGIDLHLKRTYAVLMDNMGQIIDERRMPNDEMQEYLKETVPRNTYAVLEATRNWPFMYDLLSEHVDRVELAHPKELHLIAKAVIKDDPIDSKALANLARLNYLPIAYAAPRDIRDLRTYMRHRDWLITQRTRTKNRVHAMLAYYNLVSPVTDLFGYKGREFLDKVMPTLRSAARRVVVDSLDLIDHLNQNIKKLENEYVLNPEQKKQIKLLTTIPGVGQIIATVILAEIGDIRRFNNPKALCNWAGLTPRIRKSDQSVRHGRISKQGSSYLRGAMTRAATVASRTSKRWYPVHEKLVPRCGKTGAKVAIARRLLTVVYFMLKRNQLYQEEYSKIIQLTGEPESLHGS